MRRFIGLLLIAVAASFIVFTQPALAQLSSSGGTVVVPPSGVEHAGDAGVRAHTNFLIFLPAAADSVDPSSPSGETPASLACVYKLTKQVKGCPIKKTTQNPTGGANAIAVVSAYDNPDATTDLNTFSTQFGLPSADFSQVYASGKQPSNDPGGWSLEEAMAIEWAHAMAPAAKLYLVEAASNSFSDLLKAESVASKLVAAAGGGEISNGWGGSEFSGELADDKYFKKKTVVYFASSGNSNGQLMYPGTSPNVVSAGGTTVNRDASGNFTGESGCCIGGDSVYEPRPAYQDIIEGIVGDFRGTPDFSFDGSPSSGVSVYDADGSYGWLVIGGTAVSSPSLAGIVNAAGHFYGSTKSELTKIYKDYGIPKEYKAWFRDITTGNGCTVGWDFCSGVGSDLTYKGK